jgi:hypothetical protein
MTRGRRSLGWQCFLEQVITERNRRPVHIYHPYEWRHVINPLPVAPAWLLEDISTRRRQPQGGQARGGSESHSASELPATELFLEAPARPRAPETVFTRMCFPNSNGSEPSDRARTR